MSPTPSGELRRLAASVVLPGFAGTTVPGWLSRELQRGLAGVCLFGHNVESPAQVRALTAALHAARPGVLVASDEEGGTVTRLDARHGSPWPGHAALGALDDPAVTRTVAAGLGARARDAGVDLVLSPDVDVNSEPDNPVIGVRSFGADPGLVARHGAAFVEGLQGSGVAACVKHFPGHGATRTDSHVGLPVLDAHPATVRDRDLPPFAAAVAAGTRCVMTAHVVLSAVDDRPATMSAPVLRVLREDLGFAGLVVSDALDMRAVSDGVGRAAGAVLALAAGVDLLCLGNPCFPDRYDDEAAVAEVLDALVAAVRDGTLPEARLVEAAGRVAELAAWCAAAPRVPPASDEEALAAGTGVAARSLTVAGDVALGDDTLVVVVPTPVAYAAGVREPALLPALRRLRPGWPAVEVTAPAEVAGLPADGGDLLVVVERRVTPPVRACLDALLDRRPDAVLVYGGLPDPTDPGRRTVHTYGGGRASAEAVAALLTGGTTR
jgi:beta-N-acetylhexosaminidase